MDRAICEGNRVVNSRAKKLNKIIHRQKVRSISKGVDNETPYSLTHPQNKRSKEFKIEERCTQIEKQNRMLLSKMQNIIRSNSSAQLRQKAVQQISSPMHGSRNATNARNKSLPQMPKHKPRHEIELSRISKENIAILKNLQSQKSTYDVYKWESQRKQQETLIKSIQYHKEGNKYHNIGGSPRSRFSSNRHLLSEDSLCQHIASNREIYERYHRRTNVPDIHASIGKMSPDHPQDGKLETSILEDDQSQVNSPNRAMVSSALEPQRDDSQLFPEIKGLKAVSHQQFIKLRDSYVNDARFKRNTVQSADQGIEKQSVDIQQVSDKIEPATPSQQQPAVFDSEIQMEQSKVSPRGSKKRRRIKRPEPLAIGYNQLGIDQKRKVLYRNFHEVSGFVYLVEISRTKQRVFIVLFEHYSMPNNFIAESLTEKVASKLLTDHGQSFENFIAAFYIKFQKLQILGYHNKLNTMSLVQPQSRRSQLMQMDEQDPIIHQYNLGSEKLRSGPLSGETDPSEDNHQSQHQFNYGQNKLPHFGAESFTPAPAEVEADEKNINAQNDTSVRQATAPALASPPQEGVDTSLIEQIEGRKTQNDFPAFNPASKCGEELPGLSEKPTEMTVIEGVKHQIIHETEQSKQQQLSEQREEDDEAQPE